MELFHIIGALGKGNKRTNRVFVYYFVFLLVIIATVLTGIIIFNVNRKDLVVNYDEQINTDYKVYLADNEFFTKNYLEHNRDYISEIIDLIVVNFKYNSKLKLKHNYIYCSKITANLEILGNDSKKILYNKEDVLFERDNVKTNENLNISTDISVDYNKYNDIAKSFVNAYSLADAKSYLNINLYISVHSDKHNEHSFGTPVSTLIIPLNTQTVSIETSLDTFNKDKVLVINRKASRLNKILIICLIIIAGALFIMIFNMRIYISKKITPFHKFERRYAYLMKNYHTYINQVYEPIDTSGFKIYIIESFEDLLSIRDELAKPIIMYIDVGTEINFIVLSDNIAYQYNMVLKDWYDEENNTK